MQHHVVTILKHTKYSDNMSWTDEKVNKLKDLWGKGNTASQIAEIIGGVSRNAVIGKAHRLNLSSKINESYNLLLDNVSRINQILKSSGYKINEESKSFEDKSVLIGFAIKALKLHKEAIRIIRLKNFGLFNEFISF